MPFKAGPLQPKVNVVAGATPQGQGIFATPDLIGAGAGMTPTPGPVAAPGIRDGYIKFLGFGNEDYYKVSFFQTSASEFVFYSKEGPKTGRFVLGSSLFEGVGPFNLYEFPQGQLLGKGYFIPDTVAGRNLQQFESTNRLQIEFELGMPPRNYTNSRYHQFPALYVKEIEGRLAFWPVLVSIPTTITDTEGMKNNLAYLYNAETKEGVAVVLPLPWTLMRRKDAELQFFFNDQYTSLDVETVSKDATWIANGTYDINEARSKLTSTGGRRKQTRGVRGKKSKKTRRTKH